MCRPLVLGHIVRYRLPLSCELYPRQISLFKRICNTVTMVLCKQWRKTGRWQISLKEFFQSNKSVIRIYTLCDSLYDYRWERLYIRGSTIKFDFSLSHRFIVPRKRKETNDIMFYYYICLWKEDKKKKWRFSSLKIIMFND